MRVSKDTAFGLVIAAALGAIGSEAVKTWLPTTWDYLRDQFRERSVRVHFPDWYDGEPSRLWFALLGPDEDVESAERHFFRERRTRSVTPPAGLDELEIVISYEEALVTNFLYSKPLRFQQEVIEFEVPSPKDAPWTKKYLTSIAATPLEDVVNKEIFASSPTPWLDIALNEVGVREVSGIASNSRILEYFDATGMTGMTDDDGWNCAFLAWVMVQADKPVVAGAARCANWSRFGVPLDGPTRGAIALLAPPVRGASSGAAGIVLEHDQHTITLVGGNFSDSVQVQTFDIARVIAFRWPAKQADE